MGKQIKQSQTETDMKKAASELFRNAVPPPTDEKMEPVGKPSRRGFFSWLRLNKKKN